MRHKSQGARRFSSTVLLDIASFSFSQLRFPKFEMGARKTTIPRSSGSSGVWTQTELMAAMETIVIPSTSWEVVYESLTQRPNF